jgi:hypothetical protein
MTPMTLYHAPVSRSVWVLRAPRESGQPHEGWSGRSKNTSKAVAGARPTDAAAARLLDFPVVAVPVSS